MFGRKILTLKKRLTNSEPETLNPKRSEGRPRGDQAMVVWPEETFPCIAYKALSLIGKALRGTHVARIGIEPIKPKKHGPRWDDDSFA